MIFTSTNKKLTKILFALTAISFLWLGAFGLLYHMNEIRPDNALGNGCLFNGQTEVCTMNFSEHITLWEGMTTTLPQEIVALSLLASTFLLVAVIAFWQNPLTELSELATSRWRLYIKQNPHLRLFNPLIEEFSQGILNPKIFTSALI